MLNKAEQYKAVTMARNQYALKVADQILDDPYRSMDALIEAYKLHRKDTAMVFHELRKTGSVEALLAMDYLLRKSAEVMADEEWFSVGHREVA